MFTTVASNTDPGPSKNYEQLSGSSGQRAKTAAASAVNMGPGAGLADEDESLPSIDQRNWRGIGISLLVIVCISSLIALAILLLSPRGLGERVTRDRFYLADIVSGNFTPRTFNGSWISDNELLIKDSNGNLVIHHLHIRQQTQLVLNITFEEYGFQTYSLSPNLKFVLLSHDHKKKFRHSYEAKYEIFEVATKQTFRLSPPALPDARLQYASWGPKGSQLVYIFKNNIFYLPQVNKSHTVITLTGADSVIFNGIPDWLYEEEILSSNKALWWSPEGNLLCYATFNNTLVDTYKYSWYGSYEDGKNAYPELKGLRYPKAGRRLPSVTLWMADLRNLSKVVMSEVKPPKDFLNQEYYLSTVSWVDGSRLSVVWMKRSQNYSAISVCYPRKEWQCETIHEVALPYKKGWVEVSEPAVPGPRGGAWFLRLPSVEGTAGNFRHIAMFDPLSQSQTGKNFRIDFLTSGKFDVLRIVGYSVHMNSVFYEAIPPDRPGERHLYSTTANRSASERTTQCLTCALQWQACNYNQAYLSPSGELYVLDCLGPGIPRTEIRSTENSTLLDILEENRDLEERMNQRASPQFRTFQVPISGGYKAHVRLLFPPGLVEDEAILYPLVLQSYGGPGYQLVTDRFEVHWGTYLSSRLNYVYAWVDGRGSGGQGDKIQQEIYYRLGSLEVQDQIDITRYLRDNLPFIDPHHIAIWGESYGGYVAASALASEDEVVFKCAVAVSPITSWLYYDAAYSERYMGTPKPEDNFLGYERASLLNKAPNLRGKRFLLVHGTADDNVHFQHTMMFVKHLQENNVLFQLQVYPDENHFLTNVKSHLYTTMEVFLKECFYVEPKDELEATRVKKDVKGR